LFLIQGCVALLLLILNLLKFRSLAFVKLLWSFVPVLFLHLDGSFQLAADVGLLLIQVAELCLETVFHLFARGNFLRCFDLVDPSGYGGSVCLEHGDVGVCLLAQLVLCCHGFLVVLGMLVRFHLVFVEIL
jgi:hypothetical protein